MAGVDVQILGHRAIFLIQASEGTRLDIAGLQRKSELFEREFHLDAGIPARPKGRKGCVKRHDHIPRSSRNCHRSRRSQIASRSGTPLDRERRAKGSIRGPRSCAPSKLNRTRWLPVPCVRAAQTAEIFAEALGFAPDKIRVSEALKPAADPAEIVKELSQWKAKEAMCFGHAPHVDRLIEHLAGARGPFHGIEKGGSRLPGTRRRARPMALAVVADSENAARIGGLGGSPLGKRCGHKRMSPLEARAPHDPR